MENVIETAVGTFWLDEDEIIRCIAKQPKQTLQDAQDSMKVFRQCGAGKRRAAVIDVSHVGGLSREARLCYVGLESTAVFCAVGLPTAPGTGEW